MTERLESYQVIWNSPSQDASGSMPLGNGDLAANVWVDPAGDVLLLLAKSDAWDENSSLLKLGRIRLKLHPTPDLSHEPFEQVLRLAQGDIFIRMGTVALKIWADAQAPVVWVEIDSSTSLSCQVTLECWRNRPRTIKTQTGDLFKNLAGPDPYPTIVGPDLFLDDPDSILCCHHNVSRDPDPYVLNMKLQGLDSLVSSLPHPLKARTFGTCVSAEGFSKTSQDTLVSTHQTRHRVRIIGLTQHPSTVEQWQASIKNLAGKYLIPDRQSHEKWWKSFWEKSHIFISCPSKIPRFSQPPQVVTRAYLLQRWMTACCGRGTEPIKFNGALFSYGTVDDPDFRRWGGPGFWFQNQRLIYWPMLANGDFDLFEPFVRMYRKQLDLQKHRTERFYHHSGAHYPETVTFWGSEISSHYGWTPFEQRSSPEAESKYVRYHFNSGIELCLMIYCWYEMTTDPTILQNYLIPIAREIIEFYIQHYSKDSTGKIRIEPSQALETWQDVTNPLPDIAGLRYLLPRLIKLSGIEPDLKTTWSQLLDSLPSLPMRDEMGIRVLAPGERYAELRNTENPELYSIFPYRLHGVGKPELDLARQTFTARRNVNHMCWYQDDIHAAYLGLTYTAKANIIRRASSESHSDSRFPAFWNAFNDWIPDMDHGGVLQLAVQAMLMQCEEDQILLFPAWPPEWDVDFKLHAPKNTLVSATLQGGKIVSLEVSPSSRVKDIVCMLKPLE